MRFAVILALPTLIWAIYPPVTTLLLGIMVCIVLVGVLVSHVMAACEASINCVGVF